MVTPCSVTENAEVQKFLESFKTSKKFNKIMKKSKEILNLICKYSESYLWKFAFEIEINYCFSENVFT